MHWRAQGYLVDARGSRTGVRDVGALSSLAARSSAAPAPGVQKPKRDDRGVWNKSINGIESAAPSSASWRSYRNHALHQMGVPVTGVGIT